LDGRGAFPPTGNKLAGNPGGLGTRTFFGFLASLFPF